MASQTKICGICRDDYADNEEKKPVMLVVCGHTYCRSCLKTIESKSKKKLCPSCRSDWSHLNSRELPVCFQLLPQEEGQDDSVQEIEADKISRIQSILEQQEQTFSAQLHSVNCGQVETIDRICTVDSFSEDISEYRNSLKKHQSDLKELKKQLEKKLKEVREKLSVPKKSKDDLNFQNNYNPADDSVNETTKVPPMPVCRMWPVVEVFEACKAVQGEGTFEMTLSRMLGERWQARTEQQTASSLGTSVYVPFEDDGQWMIDSGKQGRRAIDALTNTSSRPTSVIVSVNKPWNQSTLTTLLSTIATKKCAVTLCFNDVSLNPSPENYTIALERLKCLDVNPRRCRLTVFRGCINPAINAILQKLKDETTFSVRCLVTSADHINAIQKVQATKKGIDIPKDAKTSILSTLPTAGGYELRLYGRCDQDLYELTIHLQRVSSRGIALPIHLLESNITVGGLDRYLGFMRDREFPAVKPSEIMFRIQSKLFDQTQRQEIDIRLRRWQRTDFIEWYTD